MNFTSPYNGSIFNTFKPLKVYYRAKIPIYIITPTVLYVLHVEILFNLGEILQKKDTDNVYFHGACKGYQLQIAKGL